MKCIICDKETDSIRKTKKFCSESCKQKNKRSHSKKNILKDLREKISEIETHKDESVEKIIPFSF
jgi:hypothetical protein